MLFAVHDPLGERMAKLATCRAPRQTFALLHDIVTQFEDDPGYKDDMRYVQLWFDYAARIADAGWVYEHMLSKGIGKHAAATYARFAAAQRSPGQAAAVLLRGIQNKAEPLPILQHALHSLQAPGAQRVLALIDSISARLTRDTRHAMLQQCQRHGADTSFEELRARWRGGDAGCTGRSVAHASPRLDVVAHPPDEATLECLLRRVTDPPVTQYVGYHRVPSQGRVRRVRRVVELATGRFRLGRELGQGRSATVYEVDGARALKVVRVLPSAWEFYVMRQAAQRCKAPYVVRVHEFHEHPVVSFLLMDLAARGTLLNVVNDPRRAEHTTASAQYEPQILRLVIRLVEAVDGLHAAGIVHGDLRLENVVLLDDNGVALIDFGRAVDLTLLPPNVHVVPSCERLQPGTVDPAAPPPWPPRFLDYWGLARIAHALLFGHDLRVHQMAQRWVLDEHIRRYWHDSFWRLFFGELLNPPPAAATAAPTARLLAAAAASHLE